MKAWVVVAILALVVLALAAGCGDDDDAGGGTPDAGEGTPSATATGDGGVDVSDSRACKLLAPADLESVTGAVISMQAGFPDEFENCYAFTGGGEVILEVCDCLSDEEFDQEIVNAARGRGTDSEPVLMLGDKAAWVPAGDRSPNTGILWVKSGETTLTLWLDVPTYRNIVTAKGDTETLMGQVLAGLE